jgi:hypothetical protein
VPVEARRLHRTISITAWSRFGLSETEREPRSVVLRGSWCRMMARSGLSAGTNWGAFLNRKMSTRANESRHPTPESRIYRFLWLLARRGCTLRWP